MSDKPKVFESMEEAIDALWDQESFSVGSTGVAWSLKDGVADRLESTIRSLFAERDALLKQRDICHGTTHDLLDGKPLPGNWCDGFSDANLKERATGAEYQKELKAEIARLKAALAKAPCAEQATSAFQMAYIHGVRYDATGCGTCPSCLARAEQAKEERHD